MADIKDDVANIASSLANASPPVYIAKKVGQVGELASAAGKKISAGVDAAKDYASKAFARQPPARTTDIELPAEKKLARKAAPSRSLSRR